MLENIIAYSTYALFFLGLVLFVVLVVGIITKLFVGDKEFFNAEKKGRKVREGMRTLQRDNPGDGETLVPCHGKLRKKAIKKIDHIRAS